MTDLTWVQSEGGPLVVVPASALDRWGGCTTDGMIMADSATPDDYDRACEVESLAGVIDIGAEVSALVLADEPAATCYLPAENIFLRWLSADSEAELLEAAEVICEDPTTDWENCGIWVTDGTSLLLDSACPGTHVSDENSERATISVPAGRWNIRATHRTSDDPWVGIVQLLP